MKNEFQISADFFLKLKQRSYLPSGIETAIKHNWPCSQIINEVILWKTNHISDEDETQDEYEFNLFLHNEGFVTKNRSK